MIQKGEIMNDNIKKLMQKVAADESLQAKMKSFTDIDEAYEFAMSIQGGFTKEEFTEIMSEISEKLRNNDDLSDDDLACVAGGMSTTEAATALGKGISGLFATAAAASSAAAA